MKVKCCCLLFCSIIEIFTFFNIYAQEALIINHTSTNITEITQEEIIDAKAKLHIAYGHTSHGSQLTDGMSGLVDFANKHGKGLNLPENIFMWNNGGAEGALDLQDCAMGGDAGYYPDWVENTRNFLNDTANAKVNVIIWSWCGQISGKFSGGTLYSEYIDLMAKLEEDYPHVKFVYMTGHLDIWDHENNNGANNELRNYCKLNSKILYDFADIESYDPDGNFYKYAGDDCSFYDSTGGYIGNWAENWRNSHKEDIDWYNCSAAHTDPLNGNQKAYAAWSLWVKLAKLLAPDVTDVKGPGQDVPGNFVLEQNYPNPFNPSTMIKYNIGMEQLQSSSSSSGGGTFLKEMPGISQNNAHGIGDSQIHVELKVFDLLGREVADLVNCNQQPGNYRIMFDGSKLPSGVYIYRLTANSFDNSNKFTKSAKMMLVR